MLEPIDNSNMAHALDLLLRGFPHRTRAFWERALQRIVRYNAYSDRRSIGQFLVAKGRCVGVMLTPHTELRDKDGHPYNITNLSSWYVEPEHRVLAPLMLREMVREPGTIFTDLTPSKDVVRLLPPLGFKPLNAGISAIALPLAAMRLTGNGCVSALNEVKPGTLRPGELALLERDAEFGAVAAVLVVDHRHYPLLFVSRTIRGIPAVELVYCDDNQLLMKELRAVAQFLLKYGKLVLIMDIPLDIKAPGAHFEGRGLKFAKGGYAPNQTNYAGSELLLVGR